MELTILGTGNAMVTECYNTCFVLRDNGQDFMIDGGGGNTILRQLKQAGIDWRNIRDIFVTHKHFLVPQADRTVRGAGNKGRTIALNSVKSSCKLHTFQDAQVTSAWLPLDGLQTDGMVLIEFSLML